MHFIFHHSDSMSTATQNTEYVQQRIKRVNLYHALTGLFIASFFLWLSILPLASLIQYLKRCEGGHFELRVNSRVSFTTQTRWTKTPCVERNTWDVHLCSRWSNTPECQTSFNIIKSCLCFRPEMKSCLYLCTRMF